MVTWDDGAFSDAKGEAMAAAAAGIQVADDDGEPAKLRRMCEQTEALGGRIDQMFGAHSPEARAAQELWLMLRHDLSVMP